MNNKIINEDIDYILDSSCIDWNKFKNSNILVSGATGLICSLIVKALISANKKFDLKLVVYCSVRNVTKAEKIYANISNNNVIVFIQHGTEDVASDKIAFDYIIHGAAPTASKFFVEQPVETINSMVSDTMRFLEVAKKCNSKGFVYLSSMEAYGQFDKEDDLTEDMLGLLDLSNVRSTYPESKRISELLCKSYSSEYDLRTMSIRLAQTFGAGVDIDDNRVFAMMARSAINNKDIVLLTKGESKHPYLYTSQAAEAILCVLLNGKSGETYNAANPQTYCSIFEMGEMVAKYVAQGNIKVIIKESNENCKYPPSSFLNLNIEKISKLGWTPKGNLSDMYKRMISFMN